MAIKTVASLKSFFEAGDTPSQSEFVDLIDSTYSGEIGAAIVSAVSAGSTGVLQVDSASAVSFLATGTAGVALLSANTPGSARTVLSAASAGDGIFQIGTVASVRTFIGAASTSAATTASAGIVALATTAEATVGTDATKAITPATLAAAATNIEVETEQATTSGTEFDFTNISSSAQRITVMFDGNSLSGTDNIVVQLGISSGLETTGYVSRTGAAGNSTLSADLTSGFVVLAGAAANVVHGHLVITNMGGNKWVSSHDVSVTTNITATGGGSKTLAGTLDRLRITRSGTDTFDAGSINILVE